MGSGKRTSPAMRFDTAIGMGFVLETGVYCVYTCLFIAALPVMARARRRRDARSTRSAWIFLIFSILMYLAATIHLVLAAFRFYKGIFLHVGPKDRISYLRSPKNWEFMGLLLLICIQTWLGDILVIYRCYFVWNNNFWLVSIPVCLLLGQIGTNGYVAAWLYHPLSSVRVQAFRLRAAIYPLAFIQNFMTTSLIILKILLQHRASKKAGVVDVGSRLGLIRIVRIVIESAAFYTIQSLILVILSFRGDNFQWVLQSALPPSIGITFVLLAIRTDQSHSDDTMKSSLGVRNTLTPRWAQNNSSENDSVDRRDCGSLEAGGTNDAIELEDKIDVLGGNGSADSNWDAESSSNSAEPPKVAPVSLQSSGACR